MKVIDARKADCPKPVIMTKEQVDAGEAELTVLVDNGAALENVGRYLKGVGYEISHRGEEGDYLIRAKRVKRAEGAKEAGKAENIPVPESAESQHTASSGCCAYLILSDTVGAESDGLGELLMKSFLGTIQSMDPKPSAVALMNEGVRLALKSSTASGVLKDLENAGVKVLVCGTCTKHFGVTDDVAAGIISNMFEIMEALRSASKPITIG